MMSTVLLALVLLSSVTKLCIGSGMWSFDQQLANPTNVIPNPWGKNGNSVDDNLVYVHPARYPVKYGESTYENVIQDPGNTIIKQRPTEHRHASHMIKTPIAYNRRPVITHIPTTVRSYFDSPIQEYLLHAQMPLPNAKTFIMINKDTTVEPEFLT